MKNIRLKANVLVLKKKKKSSPEWESKIIFTPHVDLKPVLYS